MSTLCASSSACASLIRMPYFAATPVPAMIAAGVASPSAHGQAITSTATAWITAVSKGAPAHHSQVSSVASATTSTTGTNTAATWSTSRWIGALAACASSTSRMMRDSTVSLPTAVTCSTTRPSPLIEPPVSLSPGSRGTGSGSPVSIDSSTCVWPSSSVPSTGKRSPGLTTMRSPTKHLSNGHIDLAIEPDQVRHIRPQGVQRADGRGGLALGAGLQKLAQQHQRHHHRRALEVQVRHGAGRGREPEPHRQRPARRGADGHQQVHVAGQGQQRVPAGLVKARAQDELHRRGKYELHPGRQHPVLAEQVADHRQHQRRRQHQPDGHRREPCPRRSVFRSVHLLRRARLVAGIAHRPAQARLHLLARRKRDARGLGGQVDRGRPARRALSSGPVRPAPSTRRRSCRQCRCRARGKWFQACSWCEA